MLRRVVRLYRVDCSGNYSVGGRECMGGTVEDGNVIATFWVAVWWGLLLILARRILLEILGYYRNWRVHELRTGI